MPTDHEAKPGDSLASIAFEHGFFPETLEKLAENRELKKRREDLNTLVPGEDVVHVPDLRRGEHAGAHEKRHRFRRKGVPAKLNIRFLDAEQEPRAGVEYDVSFDGQVVHGTLDSDGFLREWMVPDARVAAVRLYAEGGEEYYEFKIGRLEPVTEDRGVQSRLNNMGYACGAEDGELGEKSKEAIARFQADHGLEVSGEADDATRQKLDELHLS